jgi:hypothetical protein
MIKFKIRPKGLPIKLSIVWKNLRHFFSQIAGAKIASQVEKVDVSAAAAIVLWINVVPLLGMPIIKRSLSQG